MFALGALFSASFVASSYFGTGSSVVGSGPLVVSSVFQPVARIGWNLVGELWYSRFSDINDSACRTVVMTSNGTQVSFNNFENWGYLYGFCTAANGSAGTPREAKVIQAALWLTAIFSLVSTVLQATNYRKRAGEIARGFVALLGSICAIVAFSTAASWQYYKDLRNGSAQVPIQTENGTFISIPLNELSSNSLSFGASYAGVVIAAMLLLYVAAVSFVRAFQRNQTEESEEREAELSPRRPTKRNQVGFEDQSMVFSHSVTQPTASSAGIISQV
jgi:hypothetical protein